MRVSRDARGTVANVDNPTSDSNIRTFCHTRKSGWIPFSNISFLASIDTAGSWNILSHVGAIAKILFVNTNGNVLPIAAIDFFE